MMNFFNAEIDFTELNKLEEGLKDRNIPYVRKLLYDGFGIYGEGWDAICHSGSYGHEQGLLEVMGCVSSIEDDVEGWLTAEDILSRL